MFRFNKVYTGIGSRETPDHILDKMTKIARVLDRFGYVLRSGGADGADSAFEAGSTNKEIYLPGKGFNGNSSSRYKVSDEALMKASHFHPAGNKLSQGAKKLHARNVYQILGENLNDPTDFVICGHKGTGGTTQACRIAEYYGIEIINMINDNGKEHLICILQGKSFLSCEHCKNDNLAREN